MKTVPCPQCGFMMAWDDGPVNDVCADCKDGNAISALLRRNALLEAVVEKLPRCEHRVWQGPPCYEFALYLDAGKWLCREHVMNLNSELPYRAALLALNEVKT